MLGKEWISFDFISMYEHYCKPIEVGNINYQTLPKWSKGYMLIMRPDGLWLDF